MRAGIDAFISYVFDDREHVLALSDLLKTRVHALAIQSSAPG